MMKVQMKVTVGGKALRVTEEGKKAFRKLVLASTAVGFAIFGGIELLEAKAVDTESVTYQEVFVDSSALVAIGELNEKVNAYDLLHLFEEANNIDNAAEIQAGVYLVPVVEGK